MLISEMKAFFEQKGFKTSEYEKDGKHNIVVNLLGFSKSVKIVLDGSPDNLAVEGIFAEDQPRYKVSSMFGGGALLLREIKLHERLLGLESEFSQYLENTLAGLANSNHTGGGTERS
jgi:hypothetical protein